jgi:hypothetical protein
VTAEQSPLPPSQPPVVHITNTNTNTVVVGGYRRPHPLLTMIKWLFIACYWWPLLLAIAFYGYLGLGIAWLVAPAFVESSADQPSDLAASEAGPGGRVKVAESTERFTAWLGRASLLSG